MKRSLDSRLFHVLFSLFPLLLRLPLLRFREFYMLFDLILLIIFIVVMKLRFATRAYGKEFIELNLIVKT